MDERIKKGNWARIIGTDSSWIPREFLNYIVRINGVHISTLGRSYDSASISLTDYQVERLNETVRCWGVYLRDLRAF